MKKIRLVLTALAFSGAVIGVFVSTAKTNSNLVTSMSHTMYVHTSTNCCIEMALQPNCSMFNTGAVCTVFVPGSTCGPNQIAATYKDSNCTFILRKPTF